MPQTDFLKVDIQAFGETTCFLTVYLLATESFWPFGDQMLFLQDLAPCYDLAYSADGRWLAAGGIGNDLVSLLLWDRYTGQKQTFALGGGSVRAVAFSPDGRWLAAAAYRSVRLLDMTTGRFGVRFSRHTRSVSCLAFSPGNRYLLSASEDFSGGLPGGEVNRWDLQRRQRGRPRLRVSLPEWRGFCSVAVLRGRRILLGRKQGEILLWDVAAKEYWAEFSQGAAVRSLAVSPDGRLLATAAGWKVHLWDLEKSEFVETLKGHQHFVRSVVFSPDGRTLLSGSWDNTVMVWDVPSRQKRACFDWRLGRVEAVRFAPDGCTAVCAEAPSLPVILASGNPRCSSSLSWAPWSRTPTLPCVITHRNCPSTRSSPAFIASRLRLPTEPSGAPPARTSSNDWRPPNSGS